MAAFTKYTLAATGTTGNNTGASTEITGTPNAQVGVQFIVEAAGATPTVTWKVQGSLDNTNWVDVILLPSDNDTAAVSTTVAATGTKVAYISPAPSRAFRWLRLVSSANTNVTYRGELYVFDADAGL